MTAEPAPQHDEAVEDLGPIIPLAARLTIDGIDVRVKRLRARETLTLARVLAAGIGEGILDMDVDWSDSEEVKANVIGMLLVALPNAVEETFEFFRGVVQPINEADAGRLSELMQNPDVGDLMDLVGTLVDQEGQSLLELVGKARFLAAKVSGLLNDRKTPAGPAARSRGRSTSSPRSTAGPTGKSST
jgi:hypothetical protein